MNVESWCRPPAGRCRCSPTPRPRRCLLKAPHGLSPQRRPARPWRKRPKRAPEGSRGTPILTCSQTHVPSEIGDQRVENEFADVGERDAYTKISIIPGETSSHLLSVIALRHKMGTY